MLIGCILFFGQITSENGGVPYKNDLNHAAGYVEWSEKTQYSVKFHFLDRDDNFIYMSQFGGLSALHNSLESSKVKEISVLYKERKRREGYSGPLNHDIWELSINGKTVKAYEELEDAYRSDKLFLFLLVPLFLFGGFYSARKYWLTLKL
jgi:hypothetical protein